MLVHRFLRILEDSMKMAKRTAEEKKNTGTTAVTTTTAIYFKANTFKHQET